MTRMTGWARLAAGIALAGLLAGCVSELVEECEPGVGEMSEMATICAPPPS
ncbi:hypothetical protein SAMN05444722_0490 [Rhodovulum sp. ES.010]|uniref:hypothetical protein n=1 Tax=Rhodovulum sp. ES.010 TaxID=1882821 RepID=UPI00092A29BB|nr:hypothetical protein [Rhodovulum sp. ES.010]SIO11883.1 hypothetical protein SAMN05444722_0490 [Rhodovulum sp. ES.010]